MFCLLLRSVLKITEYGGYKINRISFAFSVFDYRNYIFTFLLFLAVFAVIVIKMLKCIF